PCDAKLVLEELRQTTFGGWPATANPASVSQIAAAEKDGVRLTVHEFESQPGIKLRSYLAQPVGVTLKALHLEIVDEVHWPQELELARVGFAPAFGDEFRLAGVKTDAPIAPELSTQFDKWMRYIRDNQAAYITFAPRGVGMSAITSDKQYHIQIRRRFM